MELELQPPDFFTDPCHNLCDSNIFHFGSLFTLISQKQAKNIYLSLLLLSYLYIPVGPFLGLGLHHICDIPLTENSLRVEGASPLDKQRYLLCKIIRSTCEYQDSTQILRNIPIWRQMFLRQLNHFDSCVLTAQRLCALSLWFPSAVP